MTSSGTRQKCKRHAWSEWCARTSVRVRPCKPSRVFCGDVQACQSTCCQWMAVVQRARCNPRVALGPAKLKLRDGPVHNEPGRRCSTLHRHWQQIDSFVGVRWLPRTGCLARTRTEVQIEKFACCAAAGCSASCHSTQEDYPRNLHSAVCCSHGKAVRGTGSTGGKERLCSWQPGVRFSLSGTAVQSMQHHWGISGMNMVSMLCRPIKRGHELHVAAPLCVAGR